MMSTTARHMLLAFGATSAVVVIVMLSCRSRTEKPESLMTLPWPDQKSAEFYQTRVDSSEFLWFTDVKATASSFVNENLPEEKMTTVGDVVILGEGLFHAKVEVQLPSRKLILTMERPYKDRGRKSIWQVIKVEEQKWPETKSK